MEFDWDPDKAASNLAKHGVAFDVVLEWDWTQVRTARLSGDYDEPRWVGLYRGEDGQRLLAFYTRRGGFYRIISVRRAHEQEASKWES